MRRSLLRADKLAVYVLVILVLGFQGVYAQDKPAEKQKATHKKSVTAKKKTHKHRHVTTFNNPSDDEKRLEEIKREKEKEKRKTEKK
jgi:hypothetical protein